MGDRYHLKLDCAYCGKENPKPVDSDNWEDEFIYYAPSSGFTTFKCDYCGKKNGIVNPIRAVKLSSKQ
jgi:hypothetical protein